MKPDASDPLLAAVLDEDDAFRHAMLRRTVALARRRRRLRSAGRALSALAVLAVAAFLLRPSPPVPAPAPLSASRPLTIIRTAPLAERQRVKTGRAQFAIITSDSRSVQIVTTQTSTTPLDYLSDQQLLAAFPGKRPALIAPGTAEARLVFY